MSRLKVRNGEKLGSVTSTCPIYEYLNSSSYILSAMETTPRKSLSGDDAANLASRFKLLSDPGRIQIVYALIEHGELRVGEIAEMIGASESATSHQLRQLRMAELVRATRHGREIHYRIADVHVRLLLDVAVEHYLHGHRERP